MISTQKILLSTYWSWGHFRGSPGAPVLGDVDLAQLAALLRLLEVLLSLPELGQVDGGDLLRLLDLLLVRLHLALHLVDQRLHPENKDVSEGLF